MVRDVGDRFITTARVASVISAHALVLDDADLPDQGLLVLGEPPRGLPPTSLVTVTGVVDRFDFERFADAYGLASVGAYRRFIGRKIVVADTIRSWA